MCEFKKIIVNAHFDAACDANGANLSETEKSRFYAYFQTRNDSSRMSFSQIVELANNWKKANTAIFTKYEH